MGSWVEKKLNHVLAMTAKSNEAVRILREEMSTRGGEHVQTAKAQQHAVGHPPNKRLCYGLLALLMISLLTLLVLLSLSVIDLSKRKESMAMMGLLPHAGWLATDQLHLGLWRGASSVRCIMERSVLGQMHYSWGQEVTDILAESRISLHMRFE